MKLIHKPILKSGCAGFTLLELVLATLISAMVIGTFSVALTLSLRIWERQQGREQSNVPNLIQFLKLQLGNMNPVRKNPGSQKASQPGAENITIFYGSVHSVVFVTGYSAKAINKGAPVVARYVFVPEEKILYYAEIPFDPYHLETISDFLRIPPDKKSSNVRFYVTEIGEFLLSYLGRDTGLTSSWESENGYPVAIVVKYAPNGETLSATTFIIPDFLFPLEQEGEDNSKGFPSSG